MRRMLSIAALVALMAACSSSATTSPTSSTAVASTTTTTAPPATASPATTTAATTTIAATPAPTTTTATTAITTPATTVAADAYTEAGPYPVGVTTAQIANDIKVEIWYPAVAGSNGNETYDVRDFTAPAIKKLLTADIPATYTYPATRDAAVADGKFPVVLYSHGVSGFRDVSSFLTSHLASWGMIVVAPDHPSRDLYHLAGGPAAEHPTNAVDDLLNSLDLITTRGATTGDPFDGHVDADHIGALGHSAGGGTVLAAASDPRIDGYVSMASGLFRAPAAPAATADTETSDTATPGDSTTSAPAAAPTPTDPETPAPTAGVGTTTTAPPTPLPDKPSFFMGGSLDGVADPVRTHDAFLAVPTPSVYWKIDGVGHNGFDDLCTLGNGTGIIGIAEASGLGTFLDAQPLFRKLGQDGCLPPAAPVTDTFPIIRHAVTAWFLHLFHGETLGGPGSGLGPDVANSYSQQITIEER